MKLHEDDIDFERPISKVIPSKPKPKAKSRPKINMQSIRFEALNHKDEDTDEEDKRAHDEELGLLPIRAAAFDGIDQPKVDRVRDLDDPCTSTVILLFLAALVIGVALWASLGRGQTTVPRVSFLVVGDWGRNGEYNQSQVAAQMGRVGEDKDIAFVVSAGDNFYESGLKNGSDPQFEQSFTNVYTAPSLQRQWYAVLGNHDYRGNVSAQLSRELTARNPYWFCDRSFRVRQGLCAKAKDCKDFLDLFFIDTSPFVEAYHAASWGGDWTGLNSDWDQQLSGQIEELRGWLASSTGTWKIVIGHHTLRSFGEHGDTGELVQQLLPVLEEQKVPLYINGHDHDLQHIKRPDSNVHCVTSGAGSKSYRSLHVDDPAFKESALLTYRGQGFLSVSVTKNAVDLEFYDVFGNMIYTYTL